MTNPIQLDDLYFVSPQITEDDLIIMKELGFKRIINNRPDGESDNQPLSEKLRVMAESIGLEYVENPIDLSCLSKEHVSLQDRVLIEDKKTLAFCRTGTRSSVLWVLLQNGKGRNYDELAELISSKGFDLSRCVPAMQPLLKV